MKSPMKPGDGTCVDVPGSMLFPRDVLLILVFSLDCTVPCKDFNPATPWLLQSWAEGEASRTPGLYRV